VEFGRHDVTRWLMDIFQAHTLGEKIHDIDFATLNVKTVSEVRISK